MRSKYNWADVVSGSSQEIYDSVMIVFAAAVESMRRTAENPNPVRRCMLTPN
jgi:hypothetical protein